MNHMQTQRLEANLSAVFASAKGEEFLGSYFNAAFDKKYNGLLDVSFHLALPRTQKEIGDYFTTFDVVYRSDDNYQVSGGLNVTEVIFGERWPSKNGFINIVTF